MTLADFAPVTRAAITGSLINPLVRAVVAYRNARARQAAINDLLSMPEHRLRDLGIDPHDRYQSISARFWPTRK